MKTTITARRALRAQTADMHERVDGVFSTVDLGSREGYERFLIAQATAHMAVELALDEADAAAVLPDWPTRRRSSLLLSDLADLSLAEPPAFPFDLTKSPAAILGTIYVLEGSRLGGAMLRRLVLPPLPAAFLSASNPSAWRHLLHIIDDALQNEDDITDAVDAARNAFRAFEQSGRQFLKVT